MRSSDGLRFIERRVSAESKAVEWFENLLELHGELTYDPFAEPKLREDGRVYPGVFRRIMSEEERDALHQAVLSVWRSWPFPTFQPETDALAERPSLAALAATFDHAARRLSSAAPFEDIEDQANLLFFTSACLVLAARLNEMKLRIQRRPPSGVFRRSDLLLRISVEQDDE